MGLKISFPKKKYELLKRGAVHSGLYQIRALRDFGDIKKGQLGGFVEGEHNLSHDGKCWIADDAIVSGQARVSENALISDSACIGGNVKIKGEARIAGWIELNGETEISGRMHVHSQPPDLGRPFSP